MPAHSLPRESAQAQWPNPSSTVTVVRRAANGNILQAYGSTTPNAVAGYNVGCLFQNTTTGACSSNTGTATSCTFTAFV